MSVATVARVYANAEIPGRSRRWPVSLSVPRRARASPRTKSDSRPTTVDIREPSVSPRRARGAEHTGSTTPAKPMDATRIAALVPSYVRSWISSLCPR